jgi:hypothetical protein
MRWLMIVLLVSVGSLLLAAAGMARHIWLRRSRLNSNPEAGSPPRQSVNAAFDPVEDIDQEREP